MSASKTEERLNALLAGANLEPLSPEKAHRFEDYLSLFVRWNQRINLSAIRDEEGIISLHLFESIIVSWLLPQRIVTLLDFGSGGGLPGIPIAICRPEIQVTLAESQSRKAVFLQEATRVLGLSAKVYAGRAETIGETFDCVILRAVDKMPRAVASAIRLVAPGGWLALMTTDSELSGLQAAVGEQLSWPEPIRIPASQSKLLALGQRVSSSA